MLMVEEKMKEEEAKEIDKANERAKIRPPHKKLS